MLTAAAVSSWLLWPSVVVLLLSTEKASSVFLPKETPRGFAVDEAESVQTEANEGSRRADVKATDGSRAPTGKARFFKDDADISWYLKIFDRKVMIWSCRNAIQSVTRDGHSSPPYLDLSCNVIGKFWSISWHFKDTEIASYVGKFGRVIDVDRYSLSVTAHVDRANGGHRHRFSNWNDVHLRIQNASDADHSGVYQFTVTHWDGPSQRQRIYVDLTSTADHATKHKTRIKTPTNNGRHRLAANGNTHPHQSPLH